MYSCKPYIDAELDIALDRLLFAKKRPKGQTYARLLTQSKKLRDDVCNILGHEEIKCPHCENLDWKKKDYRRYLAVFDREELRDY